MSTDKSIHAIKDFLETTRKEQKMPSLQVSRFKTAFNKVIEGDTHASLNDVNNFLADEAAVHALFSRFRARNTTYNDATVQTYENTFLRLVNEYKRYREAPENYLFRARNRKKEAMKKVAAKTRAIQATKSAITRPRNIVPPAELTPAGMVPDVVFPIPLRNGLVVKLQGIPVDLTSKEADRISQVIKALAAR